MSAGLEMRFFIIISHVRLAEWSKAWDLSSHNRKIAWVRTPHLTKVILHLSIYWRTKQFSQPAGFEPARGNPIGFQVQRLNHSATTALICIAHRSGWQKINNILPEHETFHPLPTHTQTHKRNICLHFYGGNIYIDTKPDNPPSLLTFLNIHKYM